MKKFNIISLVVSFTALIVSIVLFVIVIVKTNNTNTTEKRRKSICFVPKCYSGYIE